jgi:hypothetical protein
MEADPNGTDLSGTGMISTTYSAPNERDLGGQALRMAETGLVGALNPPEVLG